MKDILLSLSFSSPNSTLTGTDLNGRIPANLHISSCLSYDETFEKRKTNSYSFQHLIDLVSFEKILARYL